MLLAIGNIREAEFLHPYSQMSSGFLSDPFAIGEVDGADLPAEGILAHKAFPHQKLDEGPLHNPIRGICRAHHERASWIGVIPHGGITFLSETSTPWAVRSSDTRVGTQSNRFVPSTEPSSRTTILGRLFCQLPPAARGGLIMPSATQALVAQHGLATVGLLNPEALCEGALNSG